MPKPAKSRQRPKAKNFFDTGVALVTDQPVEGVESIGTEEGLELCCG